MPVIVNFFNIFVAWLDNFQQHHTWASFSYAVIKKYSEEEAGYRAALLAYYGFLSIFPLLLVLASILKLLLHSDSPLVAQLMHSAFTYFPAIGRDLQQNIHGIGKTGVALAVGILLTLYGARGVGDAMRGALDHVWQVPHARRSSFPVSFLRSMAIIIIGGISLVIAPIISGYAIIFGRNWFSSALSFLLITTFVFWVLVYVIKVGSSVYRPLHDIWVGTLCAAIVLEVLQSLGGLIVTHELQRLDNLYGAFALILGLVFWLYLQMQVLLFGFEIDSVRTLRLWPRSMRAPVTAADRKAYRLYLERARFDNVSSSE